MTLLTITNRLLQRAPRHLTLKRIAAEADVQYGWLSSFSRDQIHDPGVRRVQKVHDYLVRFPESKPVRYSWEDINKRILPEDPGVYEIFDARGDRLYVGMTNSVSRRLSEHARTEVVSSAEPSYVIFTMIEEIETRVWLENLLIVTYSPPLNTALNPSKKGWNSMSSK